MSKEYTQKESKEHDARHPMPDTHYIVSDAYEIIRNAQCALHNTRRNLLDSFSFAWCGLRHALKTQKNMRIHLAIGCFAILAGFYLGCSSLELAFLCMVIASVLVCELINTAIETSLDFVNGTKYHRLVKIAKDVTAAAVLLASVNAVIVGLIIFSKYIIAASG